MVFMAGAALADSEADGATSYIQGDTNLVEVKGTLNYQIMFFESEEFESLSITYTAVLNDSNGKAQSGAVSPSSGTLTNGVESSLKVTAPSTLGKYTLVVTFKMIKDEEASVSTEKTIVISVVEPIVLSAELFNNTKVNFTDFAVYFEVDGKLVEGSRTLISVEAGGRTTATYNLITDSLSSGRHTFKVVAGSENIGQAEFEGGEGSFYVGHSDYKLINILLVVLLIVLIIAVVYFYRKPVKNYGKPRSRR
jgi:hypothetical protein